jgi:hypothetical protein
MKSKPVHCVEWLDALSASGWHNLTEAAKEPAPTVLTYGVIIRRDKHAITLAQSISGEQCLGYQVIPTGMVLKVTRL